MIDSSTSFAPASTITMEDLEAETIKSKLLSSNSLFNGLKMNCSLAPFLAKASLAPATGPSKGISLICRAKPAASRAIMSGSFSPSYDNTVLIICTSCLIPSGNRGRIVRSITLALRIASSVGRPSLFTQREPLIMPLE